MSAQRLHPVDYVILVLSLVLSLGLGIFQAVRGNKSRTLSEYLMGGRRLAVIPVTMSLIASYISSIALIGLPAEVYYFGVSIVFMTVANCIGATAAAWLFVPLFHPLGITSVQEYLEMRFKSRSIKWLGTFYCMLLQISYAGLVVYGSGSALQAMTGIPTWAYILILTTLGTIYTALGGLRAVVWTDAFQLIVMTLSFILILIMGCKEVGSLTRVWELNRDWGRLEVSYGIGLHTRMTFWSAAFGTAVGQTAVVATFQTSVQRYCSIPTLRGAQRSVIGNTFGIAAFFVICVACGLVAFAVYAVKECDPLADGEIKSEIQILPFLVTEVLGYPGLPGIFAAGLLCGSLSTISSCISSMCAVVWEDIFKSFLGPKLTPSKQVTANQVIAFVIGILTICAAFLIFSIGGSIVKVAASLFGLCSGPNLGIFILGALFPWSNWKGAVTGSLLSLIVVSWIFAGQIIMTIQSTHLPAPDSGCSSNFTSHNYTAMIPTTESPDLVTPTIMTSGYPQNLYQHVGIPNCKQSIENLYKTICGRTYHKQIPNDTGSWLNDWVYSISFGYYGPIGLVLCLVCGLLTSLLTGLTDPNTVDKELLFPCMRQWFGKKNEVRENLEHQEYPLMDVKDTSEDKAK